MEGKLEQFHIDELYSNKEIYKTLSIGNSGGVRLCLDGESGVRRMALMTSMLDVRRVAENPYHDRIEGDILVYTGTGREGNQELAGVNRRIIQQTEAGFPIYCFMLHHSRRDSQLSAKRWKYAGLLEYLRHHQECQIDAGGSPRRVWLFEFRIIRDFPTIRVEEDAGIMRAFSPSSASEVIEGSDDRLVVGADRFDTDFGLGSPISPDRAEEIRRRILGLSPRGFEEFIRDLMLLSGFDRVEVTRYSQDGGIDVNAIAGSSMWPLGAASIQVQAKRWLHTVGRREVAELRGSLNQFALGTVVTTSHFSKAAIDEAGAFGKNPITLIDGYKLASIISQIAPHLLDP